MTLADLRAEVYAALIDGMVPPLEPESVCGYVPLELATPCVWIDSPIELRQYDVAELVAAVGVLIVVDGSDEAQLIALDDLESLAWLALETCGTATGATGVLLPAGGPTLHAVRLELETPLAARTLCPPNLLTT